ncbi:MAG: LysR substrate-binding domain-containing protein [Paracoccus sp. (in: a-proteobacteria)]|uniref:LysR substrate-binding domain-containing protein n=1 Tax=Paracoccus sp. TaxID=267 RepID=UPI0026DF9BEA|nr:LysR substrate-binding domain-containing protein [Paracoccus sp. (in: a-proteobacteria)]MDO5632382.1 LysR substrate-binding domain-containing protein [Paracoccus sp. (in: a-proteobacteria)]
MARITNLPTDLLRTFIAVVELGGHSRAGAALGRSQPAISLQIRRLEELVRASLLTQEGRAILPTPAGEALLSYAREMVRINDEAVRYFHRSHKTGVLRIGLPTDYAVAFLQGTLTRYIRDHAEVELEVHCDLSRELHQHLRSDDLDIIVAVMPTVRMPYLSRMWSEQPIWAAAEDFRSVTHKPVPLGVHPEGCDYRARMIQALDAIERRWRIVYTGPGISGLQNAVQNGLCVTALTRATLLPGMRMLAETDGFPALEPLRVGLFYKHPRLSAAGLQLVSDLVADLDRVGSGIHAVSA